MNKLTIIGNLTREAELRTTSTGKDVCSFTVAVNRIRKREGEPEADFFDVSIWEDRARSLAKYLRKGTKICVIGSVSVRLYTGNDGITRARLEISYPEIELVSSSENRSQAQNPPQEHPQEQIDQESGMAVVDTDELPF